MAVLELQYPDLPLNEVVESAVDAVSDSVKSFSKAFISRVKTQSSERGVAFQARAAAMKVRMYQFSDEMIRLGKIDRALVANLVVESVTPWIKDIDDALESYEEAVLLTGLASRETRRKHADWFKRLKAGASDVKAMREIALELLEHFDPTPEDYLEQELFKDYGDAAEDLIKGFGEISSSQNFTVDAFKQRHTLK